MCLIYLNLDEIIEFSFLYKIYTLNNLLSLLPSKSLVQREYSDYYRKISVYKRERNNWQMETTEHLCTILRCLESKQRMTSSIASWVYNQFVMLAPCQVAFGESSIVCPRVNMPDEGERNFLLYVSIYSRCERINSLRPMRFCCLDDITLLWWIREKEITNCHQILLANVNVTRIIQITMSLQISLCVNKIFQRR